MFANEAFIIPYTPNSPLIIPDILLMYLSAPEINENSVDTSVKKSKAWMDKKNEEKNMSNNDNFGDNVFLLKYLYVSGTNNNIKIP